MVWVPRHEDIIGTFVFFLITGFAVFQIMIGYRRTRGLSFYGSAIRPWANYVVGAVMLGGGFAWYFGNPNNRNVPGIEGFMSLVCMALGFIVAAALTALLPTLAARLRRRRAAVSWAKPAELDYIYRGAQGELAIAGPRPAELRRLAVLVCDLDGIARLASGMAGALAAGGTLVALLAPAYFCEATGAEDESGVCDAFIALLDRLADWAAPAGSVLELDVAGLGLGAELVSHIPVAGAGWRARRLVLLNPRLPADSLNALRAVTPGDVVDIAWREKIWSSARMRRIGGIMGLVALFCVVAALITTSTVGVRWWPVSGTLAGLLVSVWVSYLYLAWRRPDLLKGGYEKILGGVQRQMREWPHPAATVPRYVRFAPRLGNRAVIAEIAGLLGEPD